MTAPTAPAAAPTSAAAHSDFPGAHRSAATSAPQAPMSAGALPGTSSYPPSSYSSHPAGSLADAVAAAIADGARLPGYRTDIRPATADLLRRSPIVPPRALPSAAAPSSATGTSSAAKAGNNANDVIRRSAATGAAASAPSAPGISQSLADRLPPAAEFARARAELASPTSVAAPAVLRRFDAGVVPSGGRRRSGAILGGGHRGGLGGGNSGELSRAEQAVVEAGSAHSTNIAEALTSREWNQLVDEVSRRLEARIADELARRGRRSTPRPM